MIKRSTQIFLFAAAVSALVVPARPSTSEGQLLVAPIVERMGSAFASIRSMRAALTQQKTYVQLSLSDPVEQGVLYVKKKDRMIQVRLEINSPEKRIITVKDNRYLLFQPSINQAIEGVVDKQGTARAAAGFFAYLFEGISKAGEDYSIVALGEEVVQQRRTTHLKLTPLPGRGGLYRQVDLWVDNDNWLPTQQRFVEANRDVTVVQLVDIKTNLPVADALFSQKLPPGAQRVRG